MRYLSLAFILLIFSGCGKQSEKGKVMSRSNFVNILVDIHTFDAIATDHSVSTYLGDLDSLTIYSSIMEKHHTNGESFKATMQWYSARPEKLSEVYDEVFGKITKLNQDISDQLKLFNQPGIPVIFQTTTSYVIKGDTAKYPEPFQVKLEGKGTYLVDIQMRLLVNDKSTNPRILAYFYKAENDISESERLSIADLPVNKSTFSRDFQIVAELKDNKYNYLKIIVPQVDNSNNNYEKDFQLSSLRVKRIPPPIKSEGEEQK